MTKSPRCPMHLGDFCCMISRVLGQVYTWPKLKRLMNETAQPEQLLAALDKSLMISMEKEKYVCLVKRWTTNH